MQSLGTYADPEKRTSGDYLWATFKTPELLLYADAGGHCELTFHNGKLESCEGCSADKFACNL
jgi:hypothetical protein